MKENWFNKTVTETLESLTTNANEGLKSEEIEERSKKEKDYIGKIFRAI